MKNGSEGKDKVILFRWVPTELHTHVHAIYVLWSSGKRGLSIPFISEREAQRCEMNCFGLHTK